jgi:hypothetical protein
MSVSLFGLAEASVSQVQARESDKKTPPKRRSHAIGDQRLVPEAR